MNGGPGKLYHKIKRLTGRAIGDFNLIDSGDRILVAVSGGKDSYTLFYILNELKKRAPVDFELIAVTIDAGYPGYQHHVITEHLTQAGFRHITKQTNAYRIIEKKRRPGSSYCAFCARLRRGSIYTAATELGCNKIALGHHLDDFIETLLLNQFYTGTLGAMSPKYLADNDKHIVIRPLVYVEEADIIRFARENKYPIICCACPVCVRVDQKRKRVKKLLSDLAVDIPQVKQSMLASLGNVHPGHLLDKRLKDF
ncbi:MAG: tRNA 2-thiocytidine(32) synthetase TtcA [Deltaproteobacteria bacterium]|nr:tRNA 2-thiocytidine(32) synthetase TtcA [Deltaproteobacteria bacterium]